MDSMQCSCGGEVRYYEPVQKSYIVLVDGSIEWESGTLVEDDLSRLGEAECLNCGQKLVVSGGGDDVVVKGLEEFGEYEVLFRIMEIVEAESVEDARKKAIDALRDDIACGDVEISDDAYADVQLLKSLE